MKPDLDWQDIPPPRFDGFALAEELVAHVLTKFYVRQWLIRAGQGDHYQDGDI